MIEYIWQDLIFPLILNLIQQQPRQLNNKFFSGEMSCKMPPAAWCRKYTLILLIAVPVPHWGRSKAASQDPHHVFQGTEPGLGYPPLWAQNELLSEGWREGWWKVRGFSLLATLNTQHHLPSLGTTTLQMLQMTGWERAQAQPLTEQRPGWGRCSLALVRQQNAAPKRRISGDQLVWSHSFAPRGWNWAVPAASPNTCDLYHMTSKELEFFFFFNVMIWKKKSARSKLLQAAAHMGAGLGVWWAWSKV